MELRDYQQQQVDQVWRSPQDSPLLQAPTGTGKGNQIAFLLRKLAVIQSKKVIVVVPTDFLVSNIYSRFIDCYPALFWAISDNWRATDGKFILVVTYQSLVRHLDCFKPDWLIIDEAHICACKSLRTIISHYRVPIIGFTATPTRLSGEALDMFDRLVPCSLSVQELIDRDYLADFDLHTIKNPDIDQILSEGIGDNLDSQQELLNQEINLSSHSILWSKYAHGLSTIFFVSGKQQGLLLKDYLNSKFSEYYFEFLDSETPYKERDRILKDFRQGVITGLINIELLILGVDVPDCQCIFTARATQSLTYWLQFVGRALRPKSDGSKAVIIDPVGNALRLGSPKFDHEWTLQGITKEVQKNSNYCCSECGMPLVSKSKVVQKGDRGLQVFCSNCGVENWFIHTPEGNPYPWNRRKKKQKLVLKLEKFEASQIDWQAHKIISDPKLTSFKKRQYILESAFLTKGQKRSALLSIGEKPEAIDFYLD